MGMLEIYLLLVRPYYDGASIIRYKPVPYMSLAHASRWNRRLGLVVSYLDYWFWVGNSHERSYFMHPNSSINRGSNLTCQSSGSSLISTTSLVWYLEIFESWILTQYIMWFFAHREAALFAALLLRLLLILAEAPANTQNRDEPATCAPCVLTYDTQKHITIDKDALKRKWTHRVGV